MERCCAEENQEHVALLALFSKVNREKIRPAIDKKLSEEKIEVKNNIVSKIDERSGNGKDNNNK